MKKQMLVIRIDPVGQNIATLDIGWKKDYSRDIYRLTKAKQLGHFKLGDIEERRLIEYVEVRTPPVGKRMVAVDKGPTPLFVAAEADIERSSGMLGWRLAGYEPITAGPAVLFGLGPNNALYDCPVTADWVKERIEWLDAEQTAAD